MITKLTISDRLRAEKARAAARSTTPQQARTWARRWRETITYHPSRAAAIVMLMHDIAANPPRTAQEHADFARLRADIAADPRLASHHDGRIGSRNGVPYTLHLPSLAVWRAAGAHGKY